MTQDIKNKNVNSTGEDTRVLIPVDFSPRGTLALRVGFELAGRLGKKVVLLHASIVPSPAIMPQFPDDFNGIDNEESEIEEMEISSEVHDIDKKLMADLKKQIEKLQRQGEIRQIEFDTVIAPGMPEEVIAEYCDMHSPAVVVMATRGNEKRKEDLIGSVTVEVIDHCFAPVMTVPEDYSFAGFKDIVRICAFCHLDDSDYKAIDALMEMFGNPSIRIFLFPLAEKMRDNEAEVSLQTLKKNLSGKYPGSDFVVSRIPAWKNIRDEAEKFFVDEKIQMILVPNRKRNAIARFFNPGLAHKILYEIDFPMLAIPTKNNTDR